MVYSLRNLLISFSIILGVVLFTVLRTFSTLQSQEDEHLRINRSRDALQKIGPAVMHMQEFESVAARYFHSHDKGLLPAYEAATGKLRNDSAAMVGLAITGGADSNQYQQLAAYIHRIILPDTALIDPDEMVGAPLATIGYRMSVVDQFKETAAQLELHNRAILEDAYHNSLGLTRGMVSFMRIVSVLLVIFLVISFWFVYNDIRSRKKGEERLKQFNAELERQVTEKTAEIRKKEEKYRVLFESMTDAYSKINMDGRYIEFNPAFQRMIGYDENEIYQLNYRDVTPEKWLIKQDQVLHEEILTKGYSDVFEKEYIHKDGHVFPVELRAFLLKDDTGQPEGIWAIVRDISARKEAERKLETSGTHLAQALAGFTDVFYVIDKNYRITMMNETAERNLPISWSKPVKVGDNVLNLVPAEKLEEIKKRLEEVMAGGSSEYEVYQPEKDLPLWMLVTFSPVIDKNDDVIGVSVTAKDITARKKMESELREAESKFRNLVEQSLIGVYIIKDGKLAYVNPRFAEIFGYRPEELINTVSLESLIDPADREKVVENVRARMTKEKDSIHYETNGLKKNGELIQLEIFCSGTLYESQPAIIGTLLDISERKKAEKENERIYSLLNERIKELTALNLISRVFQEDKRSVPETLQEIVNILPSGWQRPEITAARIVIGNQEFRSANFQTPFHRQSASFPTPDGPAGTIEVIYTADPGLPREEIFLKEERDLINIVAEMVRIHLARQHEATIIKQMQQEILAQRIQEQKIVTRAVLNAEERERNKLGRELHDNVNQILASAKLFLRMAHEKASGEQEALLRRSAGLLENAIEEIRMLSQSQVTPVKEVDLKELIQILVDRVNDSTSISTRLSYENGREIPDDLKLNIYRIVQEQINNILKYADASQVSVSINANGDLFHVVVEDNGKGFDPSRRRKGVGISNMINRVESFNGKLTIISAPGNGCKIDIKIPC